MGGGEPTHPGQALEPIPRVGAANPANDDPEPNVAGLASLPVGRHGALWLGVFAAAACSLVLSRVWQYRYDVSADGLTYLDMADAFARRDWATAVNGTYNPLYSLLIGFLLAFFHPGPAMEGPAVQFLNLAIFAVAAASFVFLVRELQRYDAPLFRGAAESRNKGSGWGTALALIAAVIFAQVVLDPQFIGVERVGPDLLVGAAFFLATALIIRILQKAATARTYLALGAVLALGYLAKAIFLPLTVVFLIAAFGAGGARSKAARGVGISIAVFVIAAAPWIVALSLAKGRLTFGETGRLNYAWCVLGVPSPPHFWRGGDEFGTPSHPARLIERSPEVYEFDRPMRVTYPEWYDPSYWYEGMRLRPDFRKQALVIAYNARWYAHTFTGVPSKEVSVMEATDVWGLALLLFISGRGRRILADARRYVWILLPAVGGLGLYLLILPNGRYIGAMVAVLFLIGFALVRLRGAEAHRPVAGVLAIILVVWAGGYVYSMSQWVKAERRADDGGSTTRSERWPLEVAEELRRTGVRPGARVAFVGSWSPHFYWARLAGVRIVAELRDLPSLVRVPSLMRGLPESDQVGRFWLRDGASRLRIVTAFRRAGIEAIVTDAHPVGEDLWQPLGRSGLFVRVLERG